MTADRLTYLPYIDGLRAVAVLAVIAFHLNPAFLPGGFTGVDVFFVISGFVVSASASRFDTLSKRDFLLQFYARRLFRIAPALLVCLLVTTLAVTLLVPAALLSDAIQKTGAAAFFGLSNFVLAGNDNNYFAPLSSLNPFTHTWSLGVEEQFYLLAPWLFMAWLRGRKKLAIGLTLCSMAASLACAWRLGIHRPDLAFYMIYSRFWELAAGVLLFQALSLSGHPFAAPRPPSLAATAGALLSAAALAAGLLTAAPETTPFPGGILPTLGAAGLLGFLHGRRQAGPVLALLQMPLLCYVGKISYSLYLWHWPVFVLFRWTTGLQTWPCYLAALLITFGIAAASYHLVETPPRRRLAAWPDRRGMAVAAALLVVLAGYGIADGVWALRPLISLSTVNRHYADWFPYGKATDPAFPGCRIAATHSKLAVSAATTYTRTGCADPVTFPHQLFMIGDSHAAAYIEMFKSLAMQTGAVTHVYYVPRCPFIGLLTPTAGACAAFNRAAAADVIAKVAPHDVVFLPSLRIAYGDYAEPAGMAAANRRAGEAAALPILRQLAARGATIVFEAPTPAFLSPAYRCADWFDRHNPLCRGDTISRPGFEARRAGIIASFANLQRQASNVYVWDPAATLCTAASCSQFRNGRPLFFDDNHLSGYGDVVLLPSFENFIMGLPGNQPRPAE